MTSRFVSGGAIDAASGEAVAVPESTTSSDRAAQKNTEWEAVQRDLDAERKRREEERNKLAAGEERSLFDILQANKGM